MSTCVDQAWLELHPEVLLLPLTSPHQDRAHPYPPGTGPKDQSCGTCQKCVYRSGSQKRYYKCRVMKKSWTAGAGTDIRLKDPACSAWEPKIEKIELFSLVNRR